MARRSYSQAKKGQPYAVEWPEWFVECAYESCNSVCFIALTGECQTAREAERRLKAGNVEDGADDGPWTKRDGVWWCNKH